ncbi:hypothetical protein BV22DRAFT_1029631 [Leucogyrophana mollusca]|uniref:Uncharacterized protein n=1 Tax=Leucogyrophana mollusca TaxID=85980 RepID=A0ACB8BTY2_9AGAM|nr:hypothetical protein BV22DRAFT_1029631 [Leucogyrophana mollusca]
MSAKAGKKRASPGADIEKNPLQNVELSDEDAQKLQNVQKDIQRAELLLERRAQQQLVSVYEKRRAVAKSIPKFWPVALMNHSIFAFHAQHNIDQVALSYLEDIWIARDPQESRCYTIEFYFKSNPYFSDSVLKKEYKYIPPPAASDETADADGITPSMLDFSWERDVQPSATKISWKDPGNALTKLHPRVAEEDDEDDMPAESGSFFHFFEVAADPFDIGTTIANEIFPEATDYFLGNMGGDDLDSEDEDSDDDDDDAEEIDLEKPRAKKQKKE